MTNFYGLHQLIPNSPLDYDETKCCLICNTLYPLQNTGTCEIGSFYLQNFGKILSMPVGNVEEDLKPEVQPFCLDCRHKLGECFRLVQQLENIVFELDKLRDDIGKSVVLSFSETSYLRFNYAVKQKIFNHYCHKFGDELSTFSAENTVSTSDFSDLLTTGTIHDFTSNFQGSSGSGAIDSDANQKTSPGRRKIISKTKLPAKVVTENNNSEQVSLVKKPVGSSKRKSSLKNQNRMEEVNYDFEPHCDEAISNYNSKDINDGEDETKTNNISKVENNPSQFLQAKDTVYVKKTKYQCRFCGKYCSKSNHLVIHERMHTDERPFPCSICGKAFREKGHVLRHEKTHDASRLLGEKNHLCPECGKAFVLADSLYNHRREKHMGKPQKRNVVSQMCETCGKVLHSLKSLKKHVMIIHEKQKPHCCPICEKKFSYLCNKKLHIERHHKIKCPEELCSFKDSQFFFESRELFEIHYKAEHPDKLLPPADEPRKGPKKSKTTFKCDQCNRVFKLNKWLKEHILKVHSNAKHPKKKVRKIQKVEKKRKVGTSLKRNSYLKKSEKIKSESEGSDSENEKKALETSLVTDLKRSPRLANKRRLPQRTISESEADVTEGEEESDEDVNNGPDNQSENYLSIKNSPIFDEIMEVKEEPEDIDSIDN